MSDYEKYANFGNSISADFYKLINHSVMPIYMTWNRLLLSDEDLEKYEEFKKQPDYLGITEEDRVNRKRLAEAYKMRPFFEMLGKGVKFRVTDTIEVNKRAVTSNRYEYRWVIGPDIVELKQNGNLGLGRWLANKFEIPITTGTTLNEIADKLAEKFGGNVRIVNSRQWNESGLKNFEKREIKLKLQPGEVKQRIIQVGGTITAEPLTDTEMQEYIEKGEQSVYTRQSTISTDAQVTMQQPNEEIKKLMEKIEQLEEKLLESTIKEDEGIDDFEFMTKTALCEELDKLGIKYDKREKKDFLIRKLRDAHNKNA